VSLARLNPRCARQLPCYPAMPSFERNRVRALHDRTALVTLSGCAAVAGERAPVDLEPRLAPGAEGLRAGVSQTVVDLRKEAKACRRAGRERRRAARETESLRVAAPEPFTPDSASSMEQARGRSDCARAAARPGRGRSQPLAESSCWTWSVTGGAGSAAHTLGIPIARRLQA